MATNIDDVQVLLDEMNSLNEMSRNSQKATDSSALKIQVPEDVPSPAATSRKFRSDSSVARRASLAKPTELLGEVFGEDDIDPKELNLIGGVSALGAESKQHNDIPRLEIVESKRQNEADQLENSKDLEAVDFKSLQEAEDEQDLNSVPAPKALTAYERMVEIHKKLGCPLPEIVRTTHGRTKLVQTKPSTYDPKDLPKGTSNPKAFENFKAQMKAIGWEVTEASRCNGRIKCSPWRHESGALSYPRKG